MEEHQAGSQELKKDCVIMKMMVVPALSIQKS